MERVLHERPIDVGVWKTLEVRLVLGEDELGCAAHVEPALPERLVLDLDGRELPGGRAIAQPRAGRDVTPRPRVAVPKRRQQVQHGRFGTAVDRRDADQHVLVSRLGVLDEHVEVAVGGEHAGIEQLELRLIAAAATILLDERGVRDTRPADTCRGTSCRSVSECCRDRSSTPSRPRRGSLRCRSGRTASP